jgi:hypothetical protein
MVLTSHDQLGNTGRKTGFWLKEFAAPFDERLAAIHHAMKTPGEWGAEIMGLP